jgi:hypothetical protein
MFKRIILGLMLVSTFALGSLATPQSADAWRWGRPYRSYYYGGPYYGGYYGAYNYGVPYRTYYRTYYGPRYYDPYYSRYYYDSPRVYVGFGNGGVIVR